MAFEKITPYKKRIFVPISIDLTNKDEVLKLYALLEKRQIKNAKELEQWLLDRSELEAALSQTGSILYINMTCHTDDAKIAEAYTHFIENVSPAVKPAGDRLNQKYLAMIKAYPLDAKRYGVHDRALKIDVELFVDKNVDLQTKVELLSQEYQTACGAMTVQFEGKEQTLPQMSKYLLEPKRELRQKAWEATATRRLKEKDKLEEIFNKMFALRHTIAQNAGFKNFVEYQFKNYHRFDYTPAECKAYHETVERLIVPLYGKIIKRRQEEMKLNSLKPWDLAVDSLNRAPLKPFGEVNELIEGTQKIFNNLDPVLGRQFKEMRDLDLLDLASRKGKAPGGYQNTLSEARKPFIFMNAVGVDDDVRTLLHEGGHAFHALASSDEPLLDYRHAPMEFCEVASMAMELLAGDQMKVFYSEGEAKRSNREHLEGIIQTLAWVANIDAYQHWMYERPNHSSGERRQAWLGFYEQFGGKFVDWSGYEEVRAYLWHRQLHIFEVPFYYIEYGIAQLGALQIWMNAKQNPQKALSDYRKGLALGGSRPLPELYKQAGIKFDFSEELIKPLIEAVTDEWQALV